MESHFHPEKEKIVEFEALHEEIVNLVLALAEQYSNEERGWSNRFLFPENTWRYIVQNKISFLLKPENAWNLDTCLQYLCWVNLNHQSSLGEFPATGDYLPAGITPCSLIRWSTYFAIESVAIKICQAKVDEFMINLDF